VRIRVSARRLLVRVQRLILIHAGSSQANGSDGPCAQTAALAGSCTLCELTRSVPSDAPEWTRLPRELGVPLEKAYRDSASRAALTVCRTFPSIVAQTSKSHELLLDREVLEGCSGSIPVLWDAIRRSARVRGLDVF